MKKKNRIVNLLIVLVALVGVALVFYPHIGFLLSQRNMSYVVQNYDYSLAEMSEQEKSLQLQAAKDYNDSLFAGVVGDPFAQDSLPQDGEYAGLLNISGDGMMGHLAIPKIKVDVPIYHGTGDAALRAGIGHLRGTSLPVGGAGTHSVLTGHTGLDTSKMFSDLEKLALGDEFYIYVLDEVYAYKIDQILVVEPSDTDALLPLAGEDYVTLVTCTPYGINSHRMLVRGHRVDYTPQQVEQQIAETNSVLGREELLLLIGVAALLVLAGVVVAVSARKKKAARKNRKRQN